MITQIGSFSYCPLSDEMASQISSSQSHSILGKGIKSGLSFFQDSFHHVSFFVRKAGFLFRNPFSGNGNGYIFARNSAFLRFHIVFHGVSSLIRSLYQRRFEVSCSLKILPQRGEISYLILKWLNPEIPPLRGCSRSNHWRITSVIYPP